MGRGGKGAHRRHRGGGVRRQRGGGGGGARYVASRAYVGVMPVAPLRLVRPRFAPFAPAQYGPRADSDEFDEDAAADMVLWVQDVEPPHDDPYFQFCLARWRRTHPRAPPELARLAPGARPALEGAERIVASYLAQLPANGPNFVFLPGGVPTAELWPFVDAISRRVGAFDAETFRLSISARATSFSWPHPIAVVLADGAARAELPDVLQAIRAVDDVLEAAVDIDCRPRGCKRARAAHAMWSCVPCGCAQSANDVAVEQLHVDMHERALRAANACLAPFGVGVQHLSFGPLDGLVVEVFPVLGGGLAWADVDALEWELQTTPVPFLQNELRAGRTVDRESDDPRLNSYPDEWFETVQQYADAVRLLRTGAARPWQPAPDEPTRANPVFAPFGVGVQHLSARLTPAELRATADIAATLAAVPVAQEVWVLSDNGESWRQSVEETLRGRTPHHIRAHIAEAARDMDALDDEWVSFIDGKGLAASAPPPDAAPLPVPNPIADTAPAAHRIVPGVVVSAQPGSDAAASPERPPLAAMLGEFKGFLRERGVTTRQNNGAEIVELVAHILDSSRTLPAGGPLVERAGAVWALLQELSDDDTDDERGEARVLPARGGVAARLRKMQSGRSDRALAALVPRGGPSSDANVELVVVPGTVTSSSQY